MSIAGRFATLVLLLALLSGCAYKPLKAPCSSDDDAAAATSRDAGETLPPAAFTSLDPCGPMRPI
ncbi:MAG: hypothetical protein J0H44_20920 [Alphaproteobacteria bacterium]|nr:hypothetical protein [Alphaproteobacteria bacterium]